MKARILLCLAVSAAAAFALPAHAQSSSSTSLAAPYSFLQGQRPYIGLSLNRIRGGADCGLTALTCDESRPAQLYAGTMFNSFWGAEIGFLQSGRLYQAGNEARSSGLNLSLVGKARLSSAFGVYGKMGTTYSRTESSFSSGRFADSSEQGFGLSYGGGVSYDFTPRLSARLEWESTDFRFGGGRDPVRSTSLGLQYRY